MIRTRQGDMIVATRPDRPAGSPDDAILVLRADNCGEGRIVALLAFLRAREPPSRSWRAALLILGLIGAAAPHS